MIVDDEFLVRTNIKYMVDWDNTVCESNGFVLTGEASNGQEAIRLIESELPNIIITDIKMPQMDGLQLSSYVKSHYPSIKLLILSNYDEYEYVRGTLKNGAVDYILKHKLNNKTIMDALNHIREIITSESKITHPNNPTDLNSNNILALKRNFIIQLLVGLYSKNDEILDRIHTLSLNLQLTQVFPVIMCVDDYSSLNLKDSNLLEFSIINVTDEILMDEKSGVATHLSNEKYIVILSFENIHSSATIHNSTQRILSRIASCMNKFLNISVSFFVGPLCNQISQLPESYKNAEERLKNRIYYENNSIVTEPMQENGSNMSYYFDNQMENDLYAAIKINDTERIDTLLKTIFTGIETGKPPLSTLQMIFTDLLAIINRICKEFTIDLSQIYEKNDLNRYLSGSTSLNNSSRWFHLLYNKLGAILSSSDIMVNSRYVSSALNYINSHYMEDISQVSVADEIGISSVYLSKLFKESLSIGFSEYLRSLRLEKAKSLLQQGNTPIKEIIKDCGFNDYAYFFKAFKKQEGITPKEYIEMHTSENFYQN